MVEHTQLKVAIAHYWFIKERGGEKVIKSLLDLFPQADIYTLFHDPNCMPEVLQRHKIYSSFLDLAWLRPHYTKLFPLYPKAVASLKLKEDYDLLISSESGPIKGIRKPKHTRHLCYTHTPMRYCWGHTEEYIKAIPTVFKGITRSAFEKLRLYDVSTIDNVDLYLANSNNVADRIKSYYHKPSTVINPPLDNSVFQRPIIESSKRQNQFYLSFGALVPYKRIDLLVEAFKNRQDKLIIIGEGSERKKLEGIATTNVKFLGSQDWEQVAKYLEGAKALLFPGEEDFGIIPLEAMTLGCPVIAYQKGGALETVSWSGDPKSSTGCFFKEQTVNSLSDCLNQFESIQQDFDPHFMREYAKKFSEDIFKAKIQTAVKKVLA